jgi:hypothetical protein
MREVFLARSMNDFKDPCAADFFALAEPFAAQLLRRHEPCARPKRSSRAKLPARTPLEVMRSAAQRDRRQDVLSRGLPVPSPFSEVAAAALLTGAGTLHQRQASQVRQQTACHTADPWQKALRE